MAIKLDAVVKGIESAALLTIESPTENPSIGLKVEEAGRFVGEKWSIDPHLGKQLVTFVGEDGPVELVGVVAQDHAIEIPAAWRVVVQVQISTTALPTFEAGRKSKTLLAVSVLRVVEVWASSKKCTWKAQEPAPGASSSAAGSSMDANGRIVKAAA